MNQIIKRDGRCVAFDAEKPRKAIQNAFISVDGELTETSNSKIESIIEAIAKEAEAKTLRVEDIQDIIEKKLMATNRKDVAKAYILYRAERTRQRERNSDLRHALKEKLSASNVQNQNANVDEKSFGGRVGEASDVMLKELALDEYLSPTARYNHINNRSYTHDLNRYSVGQHNCLTVPFDDILANGCDTRQTDIRPARSVSTAFQQIAVIFQLQSLQQFGGVSASHIDWTLVPYVRISFNKHYKTVCDIMPFVKTPNIDEQTSIVDTTYKGKHWYNFIKKYMWLKSMALLKRETAQAVEGLYHNLNTLQSRSGNQLPFTSINYGTCTLPEGRLITRAILQGSINGVGKFHKTSIFPCGIFQWMKGVNNTKGTPNYDLYRLALKSTAQRLYPNYANVDWSGNKGYDVNDPKTYFSTIDKLVA